MLAKLWLLFIVVPLVELALLIRLGEAIGLWPTIALVVGTGLLGGALAKREGLSILRRLQAKLAAGQLPGAELVDGAIVLASGALLMTPGVLTDLVGVAGLLPPSRAVIRRWLTRRLQAALARGTITVRYRPPTPPEDAPDWIDLNSTDD